MIPSILPSLRPDYERETERLLHLVGATDVDALRRMRDPFQCSLSHLPFLAWGRGVDLWYDDWPEWKMRRITAEIYGMKGLKGTRPGMAKYLSFVDAEIIESFIPPRGVIARQQDASLLTAWRERFAEIRLYPFAIRGRRAGYMATGQGKTTLTIAGRMAALPDLAHLYYGRRAVLVDDGVETTLRSLDQIQIDGGDIAVPTTTFAITATGRSYDASVGRAAVGLMAATAKGRGRLIVINAAGNIGGAVIPAGFEGVAPLDMAPQRIYQRHPARMREATVAVRYRAAVGRMVAYSSQASRFIYDSWRLMDEARAGSDTHRAIGPIVGRMMPLLLPFNALLRINARFRATGRPAVAGMWGVGHMTAGRASDRIDRVGAAIYRSRSVRDTVKFTTATYRPRTVADLSFDHPVEWGGMVPINRSTL
ncbi:Phage tail protein I [Nitrobacter hamburgensis X14]|uniref:Phage tail protein I n=1 Tax=Nitrobacter hamburgensis (strain DSM 10229 / NCIMB 13809 / X14) TaxID=323097 RepID=Q1QI85_NITHX|nr:phage tail protein I [Nitrobacter hamburgensis]ABE64062.1 Phage tail protein I [Nitrobacter hamburgensis X14]